MKTAGKESKFGIASEELPIAAELAAKHGVHVAALHAHVGSGILSSTTWRENADYLAACARQYFPSATSLDLGGYAHGHRQPFASSREGDADLIAPLLQRPWDCRGTRRADGAQHAGECPLPRPRVSARAALREGQSRLCRLAVRARKWTSW